MASLFTRFARSHITTHHSRKDFSGHVISSSRRPLPDNTQHSQQTNAHAPCGIRTHNRSRRAVADLRLRSRGHWARLSDCFSFAYPYRSANASYSLIFHLGMYDGPTACRRTMQIVSPQERRITYNLKLRRVSATIFAVEKQ